MKFFTRLYVQSQLMSNTSIMAKFNGNGVHVDYRGCKRYTWVIKNNHISSSIDLTPVWHYLFWWHNMILCFQPQNRIRWLTFNSTQGNETIHGQTVSTFIFTQFQTQYGNSILIKSRTWHTVRIIGLYERNINALLNSAGVFRCIN